MTFTNKAIDQDQQILVLKTLVDEKKLDWTWDQIAEKVGLDTGEQARSRYRILMDQMSDENNVENSEKENYLVINTVTSERTITVEDLLKKHQVNLDEWQILSQDLRKWDGYSKFFQKDVKFVPNKKTGSSTKLGTEFTDGSLNVVELYYVRVKLVRKKPIQIEPFIQPVTVSPQFSYQDVGPSGIDETTPAYDHPEYTLVIPDAQIGFWRDDNKGITETLHDRRALDLILTFAKNYKDIIKNIVIIGDWLDWTEFTDKYLVNPTYQKTIQMSIFESQYWLMQLRQTCPNAKITMLEGNHEQRVERVLLSRLPFVYHLKPSNMTKLPSPYTVPGLLGLESLGIDYIGDYPNGQYWLNDICFIHGTIANANSGKTTELLLKNYTHDIIQGHSHRDEMASKTIWYKNKPKRITAWTPGCICRIDGIVPGFKLRENWQQSFGVIIHPSQQVETIKQSIPLFENEYQNQKRLGYIYNDFVYYSNSLREKLAETFVLENIENLPIPVVSA